MVIVALAATSAAGQESLPREAVAAIKGATVLITTTAGADRSRGGTGSGFLIRVEGETAYVATNNHVVSAHNGLAGERVSVTVVIRCGTKADCFSCGPAAVATWVARVCEGLERRTIVCLNMESERDGAPKIRSPPPVYRQRTNRNVPVGGMCMYITEKCVCTQNKAGGSKKPLSDLLRDQCHECSSHPTKN